jgi:hypothetical protein
LENGWTHLERLEMKWLMYANFLCSALSSFNS